MIARGNHSIRPRNLEDDCSRVAASRLPPTDRDACGTSRTSFSRCTQHTPGKSNWPRERIARRCDECKGGEEGSGTSSLKTGSVTGRGVAAAGREPSVRSRAKAVNLAPPHPAAAGRAVELGLLSGPGKESLSHQPLPSEPP